MAESGKDFHHGEVAIFDFEFETKEPIQQPRFSLLFYDHNQKLISEVLSRSALVPIECINSGRHKANFHLIINLNAGNYFVGVQLEAFEALNRSVISRNELSFGFSVVVQEDTFVDVAPAPMLVILSMGTTAGLSASTVEKPLSHSEQNNFQIAQNDRYLNEFVQNTVKKILGENLSENELHRLLSEIKNQSTELDSSMDAILSDPRAWSESVRNNAGKLIRSAYNSLLDREPEFETLNLKKSIDISRFLKSIRSSAEFENLTTSKARMKRFEFTGRSEEEDRKLKIGGNCIFVHTPLGGIFLYCALACCQQVRREYKDKEIYLISDVPLEDSINPLDFHSLGIQGFFPTNKIVSLEARNALNPGLIISHSEGLMESTVSLTNRYPEAIFGVWSDGLRNGTDTDRWLPKVKVEKIYFFGYKGSVVGKNFAIEKIIPPSFLWDAQKILLDRKWPQALSLERVKYSVFYPRYWWRAPYNFKKEFILNSWLEAVLENSNPEELIVIKSSPLYGDDLGVIAEFREQLLAKGRAAVYSKDFCQSLGLDEIVGDLSSEDLFYLGILDNATNHYVLDGSLASIIASHPNIKRPTQLILGSHINLNNSVGLSVLNNNLASQMQGLMEFSKFSLLNAEKFKGGHLPAIISLDCY
jgi:hypothetical protein